MKWHPLLFFAIFLFAAPAHADSDQDQARAAVQTGQALPLKILLDRLEKEHPGQVLEIELERDDGIWIYEVKILQADERLVKLKLNARSGELIRRRDRKRRNH